MFNNTSINIINNKYNGVNTIAHNDHNTEVKIHGIEHFI